MNKTLEMTDTADRVCGSCGGRLVWGNVTGEHYHEATGDTACAPRVSYPELFGRAAALIEMAVRDYDAGESFSLGVTMSMMREFVAEHAAVKP